MPIPQFKVTVTHNGADTKYINNVFAQIQVKRRENNYDVATLWFADEHSHYYEDCFAKFDEIKIYFKDASESGWIQVFGGHIRQIIPTMNLMGFLPQLTCKGYGAALEATHCNRDYGVESSNIAYPHAWNILVNMVADFVEKSFAGDPTGHDLETATIEDAAGWASTDIKYINNPYRQNIELLNVVCDLATAIANGAAGPHWIIDNNRNLIVNTIGAHEDDAEWPDWWNTNQAGSTLRQGADFTEYSLLDKSEELANKVVLVTDFRRPPYDFWTNGNTAALNAIWSNVEATLTGESVFGATTNVVGDTALKIAPTNPAAAGYAYFRFHATDPIDTETIGSMKTIPRLNFYSYKPFGLDENNTTVRLYTTTYNADYFECQFSQISQSDDVWAHKSIPIGPYWKSDLTTGDNKFIWGGDGGGDWEEIAGICFKVAALTYLGVDDLHFTGKIQRSAFWSGDVNVHDYSINSVNEYQKVLISRNAMDDSCVAADDTGFAGRIAYAELLRRMANPKTITFTTKRDMKAAMAGQKLHVHACKKTDGSYRIDANMRILELQEDLVVPNGYSFTVTATTDLLNSTPTGRGEMTTADRYASWQENMFLNSKEAKNIRSGAEVDLLIPLLEKDYG